MIPRPALQQRPKEREGNKIDKGVKNILNLSGNTKLRKRKKKKRQKQQHPRAEMWDDQQQATANYYNKETQDLGRIVSRSGEVNLKVVTIIDF